MTLPHTSAAGRRGGAMTPPPASLSTSTPSQKAVAAAGCALLLLAASFFLVSGDGVVGSSLLGYYGGGAMPDALPLPDLLSGQGGGGGGGGKVLAVFQPHPSVFLGDEKGDDDGDRWAKAELHRMRASVLADDPFAPSSAVRIEHVVSDLDGMRSFLSENGGECLGRSSSKKNKGGGGGDNAVLERFDALVGAGHLHLAAEVWKYCSLYIHGGAYLDSTSPLFYTFRDSFLSAGSPVGNVAVLGDPHLSYARSSVHGAVLMLPRPGSAVAGGMVRLLVDESTDDLVRDALLVPRGLYALIAGECGKDALNADAAERDAENGGGDGYGALRPGKNGPSGEWTLLETRCRGVGSEGGGEESSRITHQCPKRGGYCCEVIDPTASSDNGAGAGAASSSVVLATRHPLLPYQSLPPGRDLPRPYRPDKRGEDDWTADTGDGPASKISDAPFIATLREEIVAKKKDKEDVATPNFFDVLLANDCLPSNKLCSQCLRNKKGATCDSCKDVCPCYCNALCKTEVEKKAVRKTVEVTPPAYRRDPSRLVPRIVHQTWFEDVTKEKYPNMSRLIESWKSSGWEYRFYSDAAAQEYLSTHFPPEVREAYDAIKPGAFKADLFRYCVLLVDGGVYADMDVLLEANLDAAVPGDVGFMTPLDEPGKAVGHRMCLWNGLIASAPGHPFLARTIETVVNNIRNRFTSVDVDATLCPNPELSVAHSFDILFTAGPCMLGMSINNLLGRHPQTSFEAGDVDPWAADRAAGGDGDGDDAASAALSASPDDPRLRIPGRTVILSQNKWDMGAHRFTWEERNLVVAATDMPDYDDRDKLEGNEKQNHYSDTHVKFGIYGLDKLYVDREVANEDIKVVVGGGGPEGVTKRAS